AATYHWAGASGNRRQPTTGQGPRATGVSGNRRQPTTGQGPRATGGNIPLGRGLGQQAATYHWAGALGTQRVGAHSGDSSEHGWSVHTAGAVQDTGRQCAQQGQ
ncbi:unnamed protein product, partial [Staurois parvus]